MAEEPSQRQTSPERAGRTSFSSIREHDSDLAQTFTASKVSSYTLASEETIDDPPTTSKNSSSSDSNNHTDADGNTSMIRTEFAPPLTHPHSKLHGNWYPANSFKGWKQINVKGKLASKSFGDLQVLHLAWNSTPVPKRTAKTDTPGPGGAPFERLPIELLNQIIGLLVLDIPPNGVERRNVDLISLLLTSKTLHTATLNLLYQRITIPHSRIFQKFLAHVSAYPSLGTIVRRLDFCHFNPSTLFSTASERLQARNLTSETLLQCLELTPNLQEFLAQEYVDDDLDVKVLEKLLFGLDKLQAIDFCGCSSAAFKEAFTKVAEKSSEWPAVLSIKRLSLHKCMTLPTSVFEAILPRLTKLTHLDVSGTRITDKALWSIPATARITHLNLAKCKLLSAKNVMNFLATHPAVSENLQFLSLATDARSHELFGENDVTELIPLLPKTLKSLSLKGSKMNSSHIKLLLPLTKHLEELSLGRSLQLGDVQRLFVPDDKAEVNEQLQWIPHTLKYLDLSDMWGSEIDTTALFNETILLKACTDPLSVIEFADEPFKRIKKSTGALSMYGWRVSEIHMRSWLVRDSSESKGGDDGARSWKMGARFWGMRKIPVAKAEVGGMYGSYMFGRKI